MALPAEQDQGVCLELEVETDLTAGISPGRPRQFDVRTQLSRLCPICCQEVSDVIHEM